MHTALHKLAVALHDPSALGRAVPRPRRAPPSCGGPESFNDLTTLDEGVRGEIFAPLNRSRFHDDDDAPGGWRLRAGPEVRRLGYVLRPDVAGWRVERMPELPDEDYFSLSPDWVCEFHSHGTPKRGLMDAYAALGVGYMWLFDLDERKLKVFRRDGTRWLRRATFVGDVYFRAEPFDDRTLDLGLLLSPPTQRQNLDRGRRRSRLGPSRGQRRRQTERSSARSRETDVLVARKNVTAGSSLVHVRLRCRSPSSPGARERP